MSIARLKRRFLTLRAAPLLAVAAMGGCVSLPKADTFALGGIDPDSSVAADVKAASQTPGPYPKLNKIPATPTDVRSAAAWKTAVVAEWNEKRRLEAAAAAIPFTLKDTATFEASALARISPELAVAAPADAQARAEAFAEAQRARATPPPTPN